MGLSLAIFRLVEVPGFSLGFRVQGLGFRV